MVMAKSPFEWSDVGSWTALSDHFPEDPSGNIARGQVVQLDSSGNIVVSEKGLTALLGVNDMVIVSDKEVTLVCRRDQVERIKELVKLVGSKPGLERFV
jgi:mannose-1-phosphate guanylyltransferase